MFNNRMLAVAAVLVMAVPALGAATPIVVPPVPEQLVEGHTVFTVIEIVAADREDTLEVRFAAAVAVLVREYQVDQARAAQRFPGVLWFNDQYLTNPYNQIDANGAESFRYPCGGSVMAVNSGDPDPRVVIANLTVRSTTVEGDLPDGVDDQTGDLSTTAPGTTANFGDDTEAYGAQWDKPTPGVYTYNNDYAWIGADVGPSTVNASNPSAAGPFNLWSDTVVGTTASSLGASGFPWDYRESYLITDPNDHSWVIDLYDFYTRYGVAGDLSAPLGATRSNSTVYTFPVWVVNMLGSPVFIPDLNNNCLPFSDLINSVTSPVNDATCGVALPVGGGGEGADDGTDIPDVNAPPYVDDPCMGYQEPSRNGFCYGGQNATLTGGACPHGTPGNDAYGSKAGAPNAPLRRYNALLYFHLDDLRVAGAARDHCGFDATIDPDGDATNGVQGGCNPANTADTNGCSEEQYTWGPNPPQAAYDWPCPQANDDMEGNSHPFHPISPPHEEAEPCPPQFTGSNPSNHGGSTYVTPTTPTSDGWYQVYAPCDYLHATRNIDIYFSGAGRPFPPPVRDFDVLDLEGSSAPFQDYHASYPGAP